MLERLVKEIKKYFNAITENNERIEVIKKILEDETLKESEKPDLLSEIENLEYENSEHHKDIAMLSEIIHKTELEEHEEERYDSWDEVFTGGDY